MTGTSGILPFVLVAVFGAASVPSSSPAKSDLPKPDQIVARYVEALGGQQALMRHTSCTMKGTLVLYRHADSISLSFVYFAKAPYLRVERMTLPNGGGDLLNGFDGETAWSFNPGSGGAIYSGDKQQSMKSDADFYYPLNELSWFTTISTVGLEDFAGRTCYHLHGITTWNQSKDLFYERETGLLAGYEFESPIGVTREIFTDYKVSDGVRFAMKQTTRSKSGTGWNDHRILNYESITFNDVDSQSLLPPPAVRYLLKNAATSR